MLEAWRISLQQGLQALIASLLVHGRTQSDVRNPWSSERPFASPSSCGFRPQYPVRELCCECALLGAAKSSLTGLLLNTNPLDPSPPQMGGVLVWASVSSMSSRYAEALSLKIPRCRLCRRLRQRLASMPRDLQ